MIIYNNDQISEILEKMRDVSTSLELIKDYTQLLRSSFWFSLREVDRQILDSLIEKINTCVDVQKLVIDDTIGGNK
jgi:cell division FtsZ-interacting protein ZapD